MPDGFPSWELTDKTQLKDAVDTSKPVVKSYSFISLPHVPTINIFLPSILNAIPKGSWSWLFMLKLSIKLTVDERSKPVDNVYSFISLPLLPVTNIFVPSLLKARPKGLRSWLEISRELSKDAVDTS